MKMKQATISQLKAGALLPLYWREPAKGKFLRIYDIAVFSLSHESIGILYKEGGIFQNQFVHPASIYFKDVVPSEQDVKSEQIKLVYFDGAYHYRVVEYHLFTDGSNKVCIKCDIAGAVRYLVVDIDKLRIAD